MLSPIEKKKWGSTEGEKKWKTQKMTGCVQGGSKKSPSKLGITGKKCAKSTTRKGGGCRVSFTLISFLKVKSANR